MLSSPNVRERVVFNDGSTTKEEADMVIPTAIIFCLTVTGVILSVLFGWNIKLKKGSVAAYWLIAFSGAVLVLAVGLVPWQVIGEAFFTDSAVNPLKILILFLSMTLISVFLDEAGFYSYVAAVAVKRAGNSQKKLFVILYALTSVLTVFTSNDVIILTFTPFILYFAKRSKIDPIPYLFGEFTAANTWSMFFIFGNPTNVYIAMAYRLGFTEYFQGMWLPTVLAGVASFAVLYLLFRKKLSVLPKVGEYLPPNVDKPLSVIGLLFLGICIVLLVVSSYVGLEMWLVAFGCCAGCVLTAVFWLLLKKRPLRTVGHTFLKLPWQLVPFLLSMFILILALENSGIVGMMASVLPDSILVYGGASFLACNVLNNIPMSVLFCAILNGAGAGNGALFATVIGSNLGAVLTPVGALAGIMWMNIVKSQGIDFSFPSFMKYGSIIAVPALSAALFGVWILQAV